MQEVIWLQQLLKQLGFKQTSLINLLGNNQGGMALAKNPGNHPQTKHIKLHYHFICLAISDGYILLNYVPIGDMVVDGLTKTLTYDKHELFLGMLGLKSQSNGSVEKK